MKTDATSMYNSNTKNIKTVDVTNFLRYIFGLIRDGTNDSGLASSETNGNGANLSFNKLYIALPSLALRLWQWDKLLGVILSFFTRDSKSCEKIKSGL